jgi:actin-related protein
MSNDKYSLYDPNDVVQAVVCDIGSYATKMGFAGEDFPKSYFRSVSGNNTDVVLCL